MDLPADLEDGIARACGECFHMLWRWGDLAGRSIIPGLGGGRPPIPKGSTQSTHLQVAVPRPSEEGTFVDKVGENMKRWTPGNPLANGSAAVYWIAYNTQQQDAFFTHWVWAVPRSSAIAGVSTQAFAMGAPGSFFCPVLPA